MKPFLLRAEGVPFGPRATQRPGVQGRSPWRVSDTALPCQRQAMAGSVGQRKREAFTCPHLAVHSSAHFCPLKQGRACPEWKERLVAFTTAKNWLLCIKTPLWNAPSIREDGVMRAPCMNGLIVFKEKEGLAVFRPRKLHHPHFGNAPIYPKKLQARLGEICRIESLLFVSLITSFLMNVLSLNMHPLSPSTYTQLSHRLALSGA